MNNGYGYESMKISNKFDLYLSKVNEKIIASGNKKVHLDIEEGKMGYCLYFFNLARLLCKPDYQKQAEKLLSDVYLELGNESAERSAYELAQIGMGIDYLIKQKYVEGNINLILGDIDNLIFNKLVFDKNPITYQTSGIIFILYFICMRIEQQNKGRDERFILEEFCIKLFNALYRSLNSEFYNDPYLFNIQKYVLPQFLYLVSKMYLLQFYNNRIIEVLKEISGMIISRMPMLHSNRLYLLWSLQHLKKTTGIDIWDEQIGILISHIDYQKIIYNELRNKDVFIQDGVAGIYLLLSALKDTSYPIPFDKNLFRKKIEDSDIWNNEQAVGPLGLINGFTGLLWIYYSIIN
jgi:hypothetical protein